MNGIRVIDDTYNANPGSLEVALALLSKADGETWLVLGDMGELGDEGLKLHQVAGDTARALGITRVFTLGPLASRAADAFGDGAEAFESMDALNDRLLGLCKPGIVALVKGSRSMRMERVVEALCATRGGDA